MPPIALITDFGTSDWYAGSMKGAIAAIAPASTVIDITHDIPPGDIRSAAFFLMASCRSFPEGTVFCVVVDPGVGSERNGIVAESSGFIFAGPDNGVLSWAFLDDPPPSVHIISEKRYFRRGEISSTFHGRDIFGPVAGHLSLGVTPAEIGPETDDCVTLPFPSPVIKNGSVSSEVLTIDRFGNVITSVTADILPHTDTVTLLHCSSRHTIAYRKFFQEVSSGVPLCYIGSSGFLEIAINGGNAAIQFGLSAGDGIDLISVQ